jgi:prophage regulatory protein
MHQIEPIPNAESPVGTEINELLRAIKLAATKLAIGQAMLRPSDASAFIGVSRTTLHRLSESDPTFPRKIVLSKRCVGYTKTSLKNWLAAKMAV